MDAVLVVGEYNTHLVGGFEVYIGFNENFELNQKCTGGPYLEDPNGWHTGYNWQNGFEAWCGIAGEHVTLWRDPAAAL